MLEQRPNIQLAPLETVSPSYAELLRLCMLRTGLSRSAGTDEFVLGNPKAWLGVAYHALLAAASTNSLDGSHPTLDQVWETTISSLSDKARANPINRRFGPPEQWPGYHLVHAMALVRANELAGHRLRPHVGDNSASTNAGRVMQEQWLSGANGRIVGRPDVIRDNTVVDFKTGDVYEYEEPDLLKASYIRQLKLYAFLVNEALGWWPVRGVLLPMEGAAAEIELQPDECEREASEALTLLEQYNDALATAVEAISLASPSPTTCRWCPFQIICPAFWEASDASWRGDLKSAAASGLVESEPQRRLLPSSVSISLAADRGTERGRIVTLAPLSEAIHTSVNILHRGSEVRMTGLIARVDGSVAPGKRTVMALSSALPRITTKTQA